MNKRTPFLQALALGGALGCSLFTGRRPAVPVPPQGAEGSRENPKLAEQEFKNIQALKGVPADQLIPAMQFIAASLGVECEYCHVDRAPEKDDKKQKLTARKMIGMMMAINKENFEGHRQVTCYSCHRGSTEPVPTPILGPEEPPAGRRESREAAARTPDLPSAETLLDNYLAAVGGAQALQKVTSRFARGKLSGFGGQPFPLEIYAKAPDKRISTMHLNSGDSVTAFDGQQGWLGMGGRVHRMTAAENEAARLDADLYFPLHVKSRFERFRVETGEKIDGRETYLVVGRKEGQPPVRLFLDRESGLLLRLVRFAETPLGRNPTQIDYSDYRKTGGVEIPFRWTLARPGGRFTIQLEQVEQNLPVDDSKFAPPPEPPRPAKP